MRNSIFFIPWMILTVFASFVNAQQQNAPADEQEVFLNVSVQTEKDSFLVGLDTKNFTISQSKQELPLSSFSKPIDEPMTIGFLFDMSGSMGPGDRGNTKFEKIPLSVKAAKEFVEKSNGQNEYFLMVFGGAYKTTVSDVMGKQDLAAAFDELLKIKPKGNTNLYDAVSVALKKTDLAKNRKKALIIFSDFQDNDSKMNDQGDIQKLAKRADVSFIIINVIDRKDKDAINFAWLTDEKVSGLLKYCGGRVYYPTDSSQLTAVFEMIRVEFFSQYRIGFKVRNVGNTAKWHKLKVRLNLPEKMKNSFGKLIINTRQGYFF